ncbi:Chaperone DnaJ-domain superfamily protein [Zea mays]|nr:Chaperone DnaJ-domain superfamily protein [Zea mays]
MHWYQVGDTVSPCECRCSRARLPPSRNMDALKTMVRPATYKIGIGFLSLVVTCMTLVDGISKLMGETRKGGRFRLKDSGMVPMNILKRDCILQCILLLWLTDLWILKMLEEDDGM